jgi:hypothetical protein
MLDLVPFAGPRREMADGQFQPGFIRKFLEFELPQCR